MSDLTYTERMKLERLLEMGDGYVLNFSNRTFAEFVLQSVGRDIYDPRYESEGGSKAKRLRAFWQNEPNHLVGKLLSDLLGYYLESPPREKNELYLTAERIASRLSEDSPLEALDAVAPELAEPAFEVLIREIRKAIESGTPEAGLDRLHTLLTKLIRTRAARHGISVERDKPLHSVFGEYVKALRAAGLIESEMTDRILKTTISVLDAFSHVRNHESLAHDNPTLGYDESLLIFGNVCNLVRFLRSLDPVEGLEDREAEEVDSDDELPF